MLGRLTEFGECTSCLSQLVVEVVILCGESLHLLVLRLETQQSWQRWQESGKTLITQEISKRPYFHILVKL